MSGADCGASGADRCALRADYCSLRADLRTFGADCGTSGADRASSRAERVTAFAESVTTCAEFAQLGADGDTTHIHPRELFTMKIDAHPQMRGRPSGIERYGVRGASWWDSLAQ